MVVEWYSTKNFPDKTICLNGKNWSHFLIEKSLRIRNIGEENSSSKIEKRNSKR